MEERGKPSLFLGQAIKGAAPMFFPEEMARFAAQPPEKRRAESASGSFDLIAPMISRQAFVGAAKGKAALMESLGDFYDAFGPKAMDKLLELNYKPLKEIRKGKLFDTTTGQYIPSKKVINIGEELSDKWKMENLGHEVGHHFEDSMNTQDVLKAKGRADEKGYKVDWDVITKNWKPWKYDTDELAKEASETWARFAASLSPKEFAWVIQDTLKKLETRVPKGTVNPFTIKLNEVNVRGEMRRSVAFQDKATGELLTDPTTFSHADLMTKKGIDPAKAQSGWSIEGKFFPDTEEGRTAAVSTILGKGEATPKVGGKLSEERGSVGNMLKSFGEFWDPLLNLPQRKQTSIAQGPIRPGRPGWLTQPGYENLRSKKDGDLTRVDRIVGKMYDRLSRFPKDVQVDIFKALRGQISFNALTPEAKIAATNIQTINNITGKMAVKRGIMDQATLDLHKDEYVPYMYLRNILSEDKAIKVGPGGKLDLGQFKQRKDLTYAEQKALGLIEEISVAQSVGMSRALSDIAKFDFFDKIAPNSNWVWGNSVVRAGNRRFSIGELQEEINLYNKVNKATPNIPEIQQQLQQMKTVLQAATQTAGKVPSDFVQMPTNKKYGPLSGVYIRKEIAQDILPIFSSFSPNTTGAKYLNFALKMEERGMVAFKVGKTAYNIPTWARNGVSGLIQLNMSGMNLYEIGKFMGKSINGFARKDLQWGIAERNGLFRTNFSEGELQDVLSTVKDFDMGGFGGVLKGFAKLSKYYGRIDDISKFAKFLEQRSKGFDIPTAIREAQKWGMDYSLTDPSVKYLRRHVLPFGTYTYKIAPLLAESLVKRPWVIGKYAALIPLSYEGFKMANDIDGKTWDRLMKNLPSYLKKSTMLGSSYAVLPTKNAEGQWQWVNLEYFFPWQAFKQSADHIIQKRFGELPQDIGLSNPFIALMYATASTKGDKSPIDLFTQREIYNKLDPPQTKALKFVEWSYGLWAPAMLTRQGALGWSLSVGDKTKTGHKITPMDAATRWFGINVNAVSPTQRLIEMKGKQNELRKSLIKIQLDPTVSKESKKSAQEQYNKQLKELYQE
jgi:hypothetical protein